MYAMFRRAALLLGLTLAGFAQAATYTVTNRNDSGTGSLRQAMLSALATPANDEIVFAAGANGVITLASPLPEIPQNSGSLTVTGNGAANTIIDGGGAHRLFRMQNLLNTDSGQHFVFSGMTLRNARADGEQGAAIYLHRASSLAIDDVEFVNNFSTFDGGALYAGNLSSNAAIRNSLFSSNRTTTNGAALAVGGVPTLSLRQR